eukprot:UN13368
MTRTEHQIHIRIQTRTRVGNSRENTSIDSLSKGQHNFVFKSIVRRVHFNVCLKGALPKLLECMRAFMFLKFIAILRKRLFCFRRPLLKQSQSEKLDFLYSSRFHSSFFLLGLPFVH